MSYSQPYSQSYPSPAQRQGKGVFTVLPGLVLGLLMMLPPVLTAQGQTTQRWFQIEVSIFSNESFTDRNEELWQPEALGLQYPDPLQKLGQLNDLLLTEELLQTDSSLIDDFVELSELEPGAAELAAQEDANPLAAILAAGPQPLRAEGDFRFFDFLRDPHLQLDAQESDFQQTNRALERSPQHRLLFHALWRQPMADPSDAIPLYVQGGSNYGEQHELQGSITLRFNDNQDRIVIDTNLWLTEFSTAVDPDGEWQLPEIPDRMRSPLQPANELEQGQAYGISRVFYLQQSRHMRSREFHYIDHPAMGLVIWVEPYEVPPMPLTEIDFEEDN